MFTATRVCEVIFWGAPNLWGRIDEIKIIVRKRMAHDLGSSILRQGESATQSQNTLEHLLNEIDT